VDFVGPKQSLRSASLASLQATRFDQETLAISIESAVVTTWLQIRKTIKRLASSRRTV